MQGNNKFLVVVFIHVIYNGNMNKVAGIGIVVVAIAVIIVISVSFGDDKPRGTITQIGNTFVESTNEFTEDETDEGNDYSITLKEVIGVKVP